MYLLTILTFGTSPLFYRPIYLLFHIVYSNVLANCDILTKDVQRTITQIPNNNRAKSAAGVFSIFTANCADVAKISLYDERSTPNRVSELRNMSNMIQCPSKNYH